MRISDWSSDVCSSDLATVPGEARPVLIGQILALAGDEADRARIGAVGEGEPRLRGAAGGGGDAGNDLAGDTGFARGLELLAAAPEDEGIAALQAHDLLADNGRASVRERVVQSV